MAMSRGAVIGGAVAAAVLLPAAAGAIYLGFFFDANALKPRVVAAVLQATGRVLAIEGDVRLALLPVPHATLTQVHLAEAPAFGDQDFAFFGAVSVYPKLAPLLHRRLEISNVVLEQPRLQLRRNRAGEGNWADLLQRPAGPGGVVCGLDIRDGELSFDDARASRHLAISKLKVQASGCGAGGQATIEASGEVTGGPAPAEGELAWSSHYSGSLEGLSGSLTIPEFSPRRLLGRLGRTVPATRDSAVLTRARFKVAVSGDRTHLVLRPTGQLDDSTLDGEITVQDWLGHAVIRFALAVDQINLDRYRPPRPAGPPRDDGGNALSKISNESLRDLGLNIRGDIKVGAITLNGDHTRNFVAQLEWNP